MKSGKEREAEKKESIKSYEDFVDKFISLHYEPLDEEFEEALYLTKDSDEHLARLFSKKQRLIDIRFR